MSTAPVRAAAEHIARTGAITPHQLAALTRLDERLKDHPDIAQEFTDLWRAQGSPASAPLPLQQGVLLNVAYESQNDNASGTGYRECFSSSAAMVARYYGKITSDDAYNKVRAKYGDTTDAKAQVSALKALGLKATFHKNGSPSKVTQLLAEGVPVLAGWLHKGPVSKPSGGGHWACIIGVTSSAWIVHDPNGEADLINGGYIARTSGAGVRYSFRNFNPRWECEGPGTGWYVEVRA